jgi:hypothetical protein
MYDHIIFRSYKFREIRKLCVATKEENCHGFLVEMPLEKCPMEDQERVGRLALRWMLE